MVSTSIDQHLELVHVRDAIGQYSQLGVFGDVVGIFVAAAETTLQAASLRDVQLGMKEREELKRQRQQQGIQEELPDGRAVVSRRVAEVIELVAQSHDEHHERAGCEDEEHRTDVVTGVTPLTSGVVVVGT